MNHRTITNSDLKEAFRRYLVLNYKGIIPSGSRACIEDFCKQFLINNNKLTKDLLASVCSKFSAALIFTTCKEDLRKITGDYD